MSDYTLRDRTHNCNSLTSRDAGKEVILIGWVASRRNLGGAVFVDLRDREGITQLVFLQEKEGDLQSRAQQLRYEDVVSVRGTVISRGDKNKTGKIKTGEIEVDVSELNIYSRSEPLPFPIRDDISSTLETRLKYRYLDLRRTSVQKNLIMRSKFVSAIRKYLTGDGFLEIETPYMVKYTPGGARNFLVPSRLNQGQFYALAESPQIYKQLLMVAGMEKYFQIAKCFRDEDPRQDRQLEFTQIDLEMSFADENDIMNLVEAMIIQAFTETGLKFNSVPFQKMEWEQAMSLYGCDKPDTRFGIPHVNLNKFASESGIGILEKAAQNSFLVKGICIPKSASFFSRKKIDELTEFVKKEEIGQAKGLIWLKLGADGAFTGSVAKFLTPEKTEILKNTMSVEVDDTVFIVADETAVTHKVMDNLRRHIAKILNIIPPGSFSALWVTRFPMFEKSSEGQWVSSHHPFTHPVREDLEKLGTEQQGSVKAMAYDLVINGNEVGGGSVRIHDSEIQAKVFKSLGIADEQAQQLFGFLLEAFKYGVPPHAGFAAGLDRLAMIITGAESIRDVIAFPKSVNGADLMTNAPTRVLEKQLQELGIAVNSNPEKE
ncbi:MAG: aspartate--tRNA ligase [Deltaproteobacteria bacterium]|nr:aspartate--tRNA ligase [Deltaproteobacteria bacterium]